MYQGNIPTFFAYCSMGLPISGINEKGRKKAPFSVAETHLFHLFRWLAEDVIRTPFMCIFRYQKRRGQIIFISENDENMPKQEHFCLVYLAYSTHSIGKYHRLFQDLYETFLGYFFCGI